MVPGTSSVTRYNREAPSERRTQLGNRRGAIVITDAPTDLVGATTELPIPRAPHSTPGWALQFQGAEGPALARAMRELDAWVFEEAVPQGFGYFDSRTGPLGSVTATEVARNAWLHLFRWLLERRIGGRALLVGLGELGGGHVALRRIFEDVLSIDRDAAKMARLRSAWPERSGEAWLHAEDPGCPRFASELLAESGPFDFLLLDAETNYSETLRYWRNLGPLVQPGGAVAIVDRTARIPELRSPVDVDRLLDDLERHVLAQRGVEAQLLGDEARPGCDVPIFVHGVPEESELFASALPRRRACPDPRAVVRLGFESGFSLHAARGGFVAIEGEHEDFDTAQMYRGRYGLLLHSKSFPGLVDDVRLLGAALPHLRDALEAFDRCEGPRMCQMLDRVQTEAGALRAVLVRGLNYSPFSLEQHALVALLNGRLGREKEAAAILERAHQIQPAETRNVLRLAIFLKLILHDEAAASALLQGRIALARAHAPRHSAQGGEG